MPIVEAELLHSFVAFGETTNFTRAARRVGISQPAFFERIQRLTEVIGAPLYERRGRDLALTAAGTRVLAYARDSERRANEFLGALRGETPAQKVTLAAGEGSYLYLLGDAITQFLQISRSELDLLTLGAMSTIEAIQRGDADLGVAAIDIIPRDVVGEELKRTPLCLAVPRKHRLASARRVSLADVGGERLVVTPEGQLHRALVGRAVSRLGLEPHAILEADGWPLMLRFVQLGLGVAIVNGTCELPTGVVARPLAELGTIAYRLIRRRNASLSQEAEQLATLIRQTVS